MPLAPLKRCGLLSCQLISRCLFDILSGRINLIPFACKASPPFGNRAKVTTLIFNDIPNPSLRNRIVFKVRLFQRDTECVLHHSPLVSGEGRNPNLLEKSFLQNSPRCRLSGIGTQTDPSAPDGWFFTRQESPHAAGDIYDLQRSGRCIFYLIPVNEVNRSNLLSADFVYSAIL